MGKGYNNYMCKKPFHPGSKANIKRTWIAEQRTENEKKKQDELKVQYEKEQDLYNNRAQISTESKDKLELNFMYEAPPGAKRERQKEDDEPEYKFEWQRKYNAPREDFAKGNSDIRDQPFGIPVRNVRCIKCHKWGHINTDKECPMFSQASSSSMPTTSMDPLELMHQMREDGYNLKQSVLGHHMNPQAANQQLLESEEEDPELEFLKSLSAKQKQKLLKKLNKLSKKHSKSDCKKKKKKKHKSKQMSSDSESDDEKERKRIKKRAKKAADQRSKHNELSDSEDLAGYWEEEKSKKRPNKSSDHKHRSNKDSQDKAHTKKEAKEAPQKQRSKQVSYNSSSSGESSSQANEIIRKKSTHKSTHLSSSEKVKDKHIISVESKNIDSKHAPKKKLKRDSTESFLKDNREGKPSGSKDGNNVSAKQDQKVSQQKKQTMKRRSSDSSSGRENSSPDHSQWKRTKSESKKDPISQLEHEVVQPTKEFGSRSVKSENTSPKASAAVSELSVNEVSNSPQHPDIFIQPECIIKPNFATALFERKYYGKKDEKFRKVHRNRRSPSIKQKYRLT